MRRLELVSHVLCPYVQRASIALAEKQLPFIRTDIDLADKPEWFRRISPLGKVPLLRVDDDAVLFESAVIVEYLDETTAPALHPADPLQRARHRGWIEFGSAVLADIWGFYTARDAAGFEVQRAKLRGRFETLEAALGDGPWFAGERFSLVDAVFAPVFRYWELFDTLGNFGSFDGLPRVTAWRQALRERPSVIDAVSPRYVELLRAFVVAQRGHLGSLIEADTPIAA
jgi:glutathione S-transferase